MSLDAGSITVKSDGSVTGSGAAKTLFDWYLPKLGDISTVPLSMRVSILQGTADLCALVAQLVPYITANAQVNAGTLVAHVTTQQLGRTPNPNNANTAIQAPASPVDVPLTGAGTIS